MEQQTELKAEQDEVSEEFTRKLVAWEKAGVFDRIAGKIEEVVEQAEAGDVK